MTVFKEFDGLEYLPGSFSEGVVMLIFKKGDGQDIRNWRLILLLNFDIKCFSKVLPASTRLWKTP